MNVLQDFPAADAALAFVHKVANKAGTAVRSACSRLGRSFRSRLAASSEWLANGPNAPRAGSEDAWGGERAAHTHVVCRVDAATGAAHMWLCPPHVRE